MKFYIPLLSKEVFQDALKERAIPFYYIDGEGDPEGDTHPHTHTHIHRASTCLRAL